MTDATRFEGHNVQSGFNVGVLFKVINDATVSAKAKLSLY